jgi:glycerol kinase
LSENWLLDQTWESKMDAVEREGCYRLWKKAVSKTFDWV